MLKYYVVKLGQPNDYSDIKLFSAAAFINEMDAFAYLFRSVPGPGSSVNSMHAIVSFPDSYTIAGVRAALAHSNAVGRGECGKCLHCLAAMDETARKEKIDKIFKPKELAPDVDAFNKQLNETFDKAVDTLLPLAMSALSKFFEGKNDGPKRRDS